MSMHFTGRTWRPPYEANSYIIQLTSGCTYGKCSFCNLYKEEPFCLSPLSIFEEDLAEIKKYQPNARRIFLTGANPFALSYEKLKPYVLIVRDYLIKCQTIAMFASISDIKNKEMWQLKKLRAMGVNGLSIGTESGDDDTLLLANKGYTSKDILEQCRKLDEAGIEYYFVHVDSLTLFPGTGLYELAREGKFLPAGEKERLKEMQIFIKNLQIRTHLFANTISNFYPVTAYLPKEREKVIDELQQVMESFSEEEMVRYRIGLKSLG